MKTWLVNSLLLVCCVGFVGCTESEVHYMDKPNTMYLKDKDGTVYRAERKWENSENVYDVYKIPTEELRGLIDDPLSPPPPASVEFKVCPECKSQRSRYLDFEEVSPYDCPTGTCPDDGDCFNQSCPKGCNDCNCPAPHARPTPFKPCLTDVLY